MGTILHGIRIFGMMFIINPAVVAAIGLMVSSLLGGVPVFSIGWMVSWGVLAFFISGYFFLMDCESTVIEKAVLLCLLLFLVAVLGSLHTQFLTILLEKKYVAVEMNAGEAAESGNSLGELSEKEISSMIKIPSWGGIAAMIVAGFLCTRLAILLLDKLDVLVERWIPSRGVTV